MAFGILCTMRDEAPFLLEWLAYHKAIGFDRIVVYSNDCTDGTDSMLAALAQHGELVHVPHSPAPTEGVAAAVAKHAIQAQHFEDGDWVIWLDADEFLNVHLGSGRVTDLIERLGDAEGICLSWRLFGDSGQEGVRNGFINPDFTRCAAPNDGWMNVKTLFRQSDEVRAYFQHRPIMSREFWTGGYFLSGTGRPLTDGGRHLTLWQQGQRRGKIDNEDAGWDWAQINHYAVRTRKYFEMKQRRGRIGVPNEGAPLRYTDKYFAELNKNDDEDRSILRWQSATEEGIRRLEEKLAVKMQDAPMDQDAARYKAMHVAHNDELDARRYANQKLAAAIVEATGPRTLVDVGCGIGILMSELQQRGTEVLGVEGHWLEDAATVCPAENYHRSDLEEELRLDATYDVCVSIEVAEHLEKTRARSFVADLCRLSDAVVFSAAIPGQGGQGHKNEQWQQYWAEMFEDEGYGAFDVFRPRFLRDMKMLPWIRQNVLLFVRKGHDLAESHAADRISPEACNMILPEYHRKVLRRTRRVFKKKLEDARVRANA